MRLVGLLVGAVICGLPYLFYPAEFPPLVITAIALLLASLGLAIMRPADKWQSGIGVGAGILVPIVAIILIDLQRDPTSHNLFPFEIAFGLVFATPVALLGAWLGGFVGRSTHVPASAGAAICAVGVLTAAIHVPFVFADRNAGEVEARARLRALVTAQKRFSNRRGDYTCNLGELEKRFDTPVRRHPSSPPMGGIYGRGTWAAAGEYEFKLLCSQAIRSDRFVLLAAPVRTSLGRWVYCAEADGVIRRVERSRYDYCLNEGMPLDH